MIHKKRILQAARFYVVLDSDVADFKKLFGIFKKTVDAGAGIVQLRSKYGSATDILDFSKKAIEYAQGRALFIVNDRADFAIASGCDGVHLGQDDVSLKQARAILGFKFLIGISCQTLDQARRAQKDGADYIGFGSVFKTQTKPERQQMDLKLLLKVSREIKIPVFFIGGITLDNISQVMINGGQRIAVTRAICEAKNVAVVTKKFLFHCEERSKGV
ncbi:MAG: thiamine phosphate synthase [Candidatus Omnitrophica bacterium]|nr:thiamine phosphate synthase [Candidatus Omnitrophota bacterium]